jgi:insertion element IS1 protein InsB
MECKYCKGACVKAGFQRNSKQKYRCKACRKYQQVVYDNKAYELTTNQSIVTLLVEGMGIRSIARVLKIALSTVVTRIKKIARSIKKPNLAVRNNIYEIDELWTYIKSKSNETWIMYALDRQSKMVLDFRVGARTKLNLQQLTDTALHHTPMKICTDGLNIYRSLIPQRIHRTGLTDTRHIERNNLNIRTHLKRLSRKTICFSKSEEMLKACLRIYFWNPGSIENTTQVERGDNPDKCRRTNVNQ